MSCSPARLAANRANARKSTGPATLEGKGRSRRNSLKHGQTGAGVVIPEEDAAEVARRSAAFEAELRPSGDLGRFLARRAAALSVRLDRSVRHELAALAARARAAVDAQADEVDRQLAAIADAPAATARKLRRSPEGLEALIAGLLHLGADLAHPDPSRWGPDHPDRLAHLTGRRPEELAATPLGDDARAARGDFAAPAPEGEAGLLPSARRARARDRVAGAIDAEVAALRDLLGALDPEEVARDRAEAPDRALFDPSREATLARKYEAATERSFYRTLREFRDAEQAAREAEDVAPAPGLVAEVGSFLPADPGECGEPSEAPDEALGSIFPIPDQPGRAPGDGIPGSRLAGEDDRPLPGSPTGSIGESPRRSPARVGSRS